MPAPASHAEEIMTLELAGEDPESRLEDRADLQPGLSAAPAGKPFRLYPEWAQRGPFW